MKERRKPEYPEKTPGDKLQKLWSVCAQFLESLKSQHLRLANVSLTCHSLVGLFLGCLTSQQHVNCQMYLMIRSTHSGEPRGGRHIPHCNLGDPLTGNCDQTGCGDGGGDGGGGGAVTEGGDLLIS